MKEVEGHGIRIVVSYSGQKNLTARMSSNRLQMSRLCRRSRGATILGARANGDHESVSGGFRA